MKFLSLDLEMNQPSNNIIQIGACIGESITGEIIETLSAFVSIPEPLTERICQLTGITDNILETEGTTLPEAYSKLVEMCARYPDRMPALVQWGSGDEHALKSQLSQLLGVQELPNWPFGRGGAFDTKKMYQAYRIANGLNYRSGLGKSMARCGLQFKGRAHDALNDSLNTFTIFRHLLGKLKDGHI